MKQLASTIGSMGLLVHLLTVGAHAQNTINEIVENNLTASGESICIGDDANYVAQISGPDYFSSAEWYFKWTGCDPAAQEVRMKNSNGDPLSGLSAIQQHGKLGSFSLRVRVRFAKATGGNYTVEKTANFTVLPPDRVKLSNPKDVLDVNIPTVPPGPNAEPTFVVAFDIMRDDRILQCGGTALEEIEREKYGIGGEDYPFGPADYLSTTVGAILDRKGVLGDAAYHLLLNGIVVDEFDQTLGLRLPTGCGPEQDIVLSPIFHFKMVKVDNDHWKLVRVP